MKKEKNLVINNYEFSANSSKMLQKFKEQMLRYTELEKKIRKLDRQISYEPTSTISEEDDDSSSVDMDERPLIRLQRLVYKHLMKKRTLKEVQRHDFTIPSLKKKMSLIYLKNVLEKFLPTGESPTLKAKYVQIGLN